MVNAQPQEAEFNILDYWKVIWKRRRMIVWLFVGTVLTAMVVSMLMPKIYESSATILPQMDTSQGGGLSGLLSAAGGAGVAQGLGISMPGMPATPTDIFAALLKSRIMADEVIKKFDLMKLYQAKTMTDARRALEGTTKITVSKEKVIKITVEGPNPQLVSDIVNFYAANLDRLNRTINVTKSGQNRVFLEKRLIETKANMVKAEEALKEFQTRNKFVALDAQAKSAIGAAAQVQADISATEVQLQVMKTYLTSDHPEVAGVQSSLAELKKQLALMETGQGGHGQHPGDRTHLVFTSVPASVLEYGRLLREVKVQEALLTMLIAQHEQAKIAEVRDTPTVQVLDSAVPGERKIKPSISGNMMIAGALALLLGVFLSFFLEYLERMRVAAEENAESARTFSPSLAYLGRLKKQAKG